MVTLLEQHKILILKALQNSLQVNVVIPRIGLNLLEFEQEIQVQLLA